MKKIKLISNMCLLGLMTLAVACTDVDLANVNGANTNNDVENLSGDFSRTLVVDNFLYGVDNTTLMTYDISDNTNPVKVGSTTVSTGLETIYHHDGNLFLGSRRGMFVYTISDSGLPQRRGSYNYSNLPIDIEPCDPVVAEGNLAFASLYTGDGNDFDCGERRNLQTIVALNVSNLDNPTLISMTDVRTPRGLAIDGNLLFVCNNTNGLTVYDTRNPSNLELLEQVNNIDAWDAIAEDNLLIVVSATEIIQYDYSDPQDLKELSRRSLPNL